LNCVFHMITLVSWRYYSEKMFRDYLYKFNQPLTKMLLRMIIHPMSNNPINQFYLLDLQLKLIKIGN
jgi:hypothetical protein